MPCSLGNTSRFEPSTSTVVVAASKAVCRERSRSPKLWLLPEPVEARGIALLATAFSSVVASLTVVALTTITKYDVPSVSPPIAVPLPLR